MKLPILAMLLFFILSKNYAQEYNYRELEEKLFSEGYSYSSKPFLHLPYEYKYHKGNNRERSIEIVLYEETFKEGIMYYFIFLSRTEANNIVIAIIYDEEKNAREYYKINTENEPANTWVETDMNNDGVIEEGEGHIAWW